MSTGSCDLWSAKALRAGMGAHVSECVFVCACLRVRVCVCVFACSCIFLRVLLLTPSQLPPPLTPQFRLRITCGARARDVDSCPGAIAALQAGGSIKLEQAAEMQFNRIMVSTRLFG